MRFLTPLRSIRNDCATWGEMGKNSGNGLRFRCFSPLTHAGFAVILNEVKNLFFHGFIYLRV